MPSREAPPILRGLAGLGVSLGRTGDSLKPLRAGLSEKGFPLPHDVEFWSWRRLAEGKEAVKNGNRYVLRITAYEVLRENNCEGKVGLLAEMVDRALDLRASQKGLPHRFNSEGLVSALGGEFGLSDQVVRKILRGVRAEMVLEMARNSNEQVVPAFRRAAEAYFRAYTDPGLNSPSQRVVFVQKIEGDWDGSMAGFYKLLYRRASGRGVGGFLPYELVAMKVYLEAREGLGCPLSFLDRLVLFRMWKNVEPMGLVKTVRDKTAVRVDDHVLAIAGRLLVQGRG